jgi:hypothetical protein
MQTQCDFDYVITDRRATSVPATELPRKKYRKIGRNLELPEERLVAKFVEEVVKVRKAVSRMETKFNTQQSILLEICQSIETHGF